MQCQFLLTFRKTRSMAMVIDNRLRLQAGQSLLLTPWYSMYTDPAIAEESIP
jgi:hypothetical protein